MFARFPGWSKDRVSVRTAFVVVSSVCCRQPVRCDREYLSTRLSTLVDARTTQVKHISDIFPPFTRLLENKFHRMSRFTLLYRVLTSVTFYVERRIVNIKVVVKSKRRKHGKVFLSIPLYSWSVEIRKGKLVENFILVTRIKSLKESVISSFLNLLVLRLRLYSRLTRR